MSEKDPDKYACDEFHLSYECMTAIFGSKPHAKMMMREFIKENHTSKREATIFTVSAYKKILEVPDGNHYSTEVTKALGLVGSDKTFERNQIIDSHYLFHEFDENPPRTNKKTDDKIIKELRKKGLDLDLRGKPKTDDSLRQDIKNLRKTITNL